MRIKCLDCGNSEEVSLELFVKIIGVSTAGFGFWAWVSFLFAGTGFALPICIAIATGGVGMLAFKDQIVDWVVNKGYECDGCGNQKWTSVSPEAEKEMNAKEDVIRNLEKEAEHLRKSFSVKEKDALDYIKRQDSSFSMEDIEELLGEIEEKDCRIEALLKDKEEWDKHKDSLLLAQEKVVVNLQKRFSTCYTSLSFSDRSLKQIARLAERERSKLELQLGLLQHNSKSANFRDDIMGTDVKELGFGNGGRLYIRKEGSRFLVVCVGNKNSQNADLKHLKRAYKES